MEVFKKKILFVEDEPSLLSLYYTVFTNEGYEVFLANTVDNAQSIIDECRGLNLIILDISLPGKDGLEMLKDLRLEGNITPVLINTAFPQFQTDNEVWQAQGYNVKSSNLENLKERIRSLSGDLVVQ